MKVKGRSVGLVDLIGTVKKTQCSHPNTNLIGLALTVVQESLTVPLIEHAADYAEDGSGKASPLWTLTTKVAFEKQ